MSEFDILRWIESSRGSLLYSRLISRPVSKSLLSPIGLPLPAVDRVFHCLLTPPIARTLQKVQQGGKKGKANKSRNHTAHKSVPALLRFQIRQP